MIQIYTTANCNFSYITGLSQYVGKAKEAMAEVLTKPKSYHHKAGDPPTIRIPNCGFYLFAQSSEGKTADNPYCPQFEALIRDENLGPVVQHDAKNPLHGMKVGSLYVWIPDKEALQAWWKKNVFEPWKANHANP